MTSVQPLPDFGATDETDDDETYDSDFVRADEGEDSDDLLDGDAAGAQSAKGRGTGRGRSKITGRTVRQIIAKHAEVDAAPADQRRILASSLGVRDDAIDITAHIVQTPRVQLAGFMELEQVIDVADNPFEAMAKTFQFESAHRQMWAVLSELGIVTGNLPGKETTAATQIAKACTAVTAEHRATLEAVRTLSRKAA